MPGIGRDAAMAPVLEVKLEEAETFKYPRGVALRANGIDWDYLILPCTGCEGGPSEKKIPIQDQMVNYEWRLNGKGSLNTPFDAKKHEDAMKRIEEILKRLDEITKKIAELQMAAKDAVSALEQKKKAAEKEIARVEEELKLIEDELKKVGEELKKIEELLKQQEAKKSQAESELKQKQEELVKVLEEIEKLEDKLSGKPTEAEKQKLAEATAKREELKAAEEQLKQKLDQIVSTGKALRDAIIAAEQQLLTVTNSYASLKQQGEQRNKEIADLQSILYTPRGGREYFQARRDWAAKASAIINGFFTANRVSLSASMQEVQTEGQAVFATRSNPQRDAKLASFRTKLNAFTSMLNSACDTVKVGKSDCRSAAAVVASAATSYDSAVTTGERVMYVMDPQVLQRLDAARAALAQLNPAIQQASNAVKQQSTAYQSAIAQYRTTMKQLEQEKTQLTEQVEQKRTASALAEKAYQDLVNARLQDLAQNGDTYAEQLKQEREKEIGLLNGINGLEKTIEHLIDTIKTLTLDKEMLASKKKELEEQRDALKAKLEKLKALLNSKPPTFEDEIAALEEEKKTLEEELKQKKQEAAAALAGSKSASGPIVYYIPPPLEEIMKEDARKKFEALKDSVKAAEAEVALAKAFKAEVQVKLLTEFENVARQLTVYKTNFTQKDELKKQLNEAEKELLSEKGKATEKYLDFQLKVQETIQRSEQEKKKAEENKKEAEAEVEGAKKEVDEAQKELEDADKARLQYDMTLRDLHSQYDFHEKQVNALKSTVKERSDELKQEQAKLKEIEKELGRANKELSRANAGENEAAITSARAKVQQLDAQLTLQKTKVQQVESALESAKSSLTGAQTSLDQSLAAIRQHEATFLDVTRNYKKAEDRLFHARQDHEEVLSELNMWTDIVKRAETIIDEMYKKRDKAQEMVQEKVNEEVKAEEKKKAIDELKEEVEKAEKAMAEAEKKAAESLKKKEELIKEAEEKLEQAKEKLKKAEQELRDFLVQEFEKPEHKDELIIEAVNVPLDGWRTGEGKRRITATILYMNNRTPMLQAPVPTWSKPPGSSKTSVCNPTFTPKSDPPFGKVEPSFKMPEPRTIALMYKNGEPLWPEWPVIETSEVLAKDVVQLKTSNGDMDQFLRGCIVEVFCCSPVGDGPHPIRDFMHYRWLPIDGRYINGAAYDEVFWEPPIIEKPDCDKELKFKAKYSANGIAGDPEPEEESKKKVKAGVLIEIPKELLGSPNEKITVKPRIVRGDHTGIDNETVEYKVTKVAGESSKWGIDQKEKETVPKETKNGGYAEADFYFGDGFAKFKIEVTWKRGSVCETKSFDAISPLYLRFLRLASGPSTQVWNATKGVWNAPGTFVSAAKGLPDEGPFTAVEGVTGLHDENRDFVNDKELTYKPAIDTIKLDPKKVKTELFGIGRTEVKNPPEEASFAVNVKIEEKYKDVTRPPEENKEYSTEKIKKIKIGPAALPFVFVLEEEFDKGVTITTKAKIESEIGGILIDAIKDVEFSVVEVITDDNVDANGAATAVGGYVKWESDAGVKPPFPGFDVVIKSIGVSANLAGELQGTIARPKIPSDDPEEKEEEEGDDEVRFIAEADANGNFYGEVENFPEFNFYRFKMLKGSAFAVDFSETRSAENFDEDFKGIVVRKADMQLPEEFSRQGGELPSVLTIEDFGVGVTKANGLCVQGKIELSGSLFSIGFAGYEFEAKSIRLEFGKGSVDGKFEGSVKLPIPFEGSLDLSVEKAGSKWTGKLSTGEPVTIPRLGLVVQVSNSSKIQWDFAKDEGSLELTANIRSKTLGEMQITGLEVTSKGEFKGEIALLSLPQIKFGTGFNLHIDKVSFKKEEGPDYALVIAGGFGFPVIEKLDATVTILPGPKISINPVEMEVKFEKSPMLFAGAIAYDGNVFKGEFEVGISNLAAKGGKGGSKGIYGMFIIGSHPINETTSYSFWYVEMVLKGSIPLGQTGLSLLELGGGVGYNYDPPIGEQKGAPRNSGTMAFKAIIGMGNAPSGEIFAGRLTMVLTNQVFSLNGKVWLLSKEDAMFGEGQLNLWFSDSHLDGFVRMFVGIPDAKGKVFRFNGRIDYFFGNTWWIKTNQKISGALFNEVKAEASLDIRDGFIDAEGNLTYGLKKDIPLAIVTLKIVVDVRASGALKLVTKPSFSMYANAEFHGSWDVNVDTPAGEYDVLAGGLHLRAELIVANNVAELRGSAGVSYSILWWSGSEQVDLGIRVNI